MEVNNKEAIREYLQHVLPTDSDNYYVKFEALVRSKDNPENPLMEGHNGSFLVHSWIIQSVEKYDKHIDSMIHLCKLTGARLYMTTDAKEVSKTALSLFDYANDLVKNMTRNNKVSIKNVFNVMNSLTSKGEVSAHGSRMILLDIDNKSFRKDIELTLKELEPSFLKKGVMTVIDTLHGCHIIFPRLYLYFVEDFINSNNGSYFDVKTNALTLVYAKETK